MALLKLSTAYTRAFLLIDSADHITGKTGVTPTVTLSKAGGAFGAAGGTVTEIANGFYKIAYTTTDANTLGDLAVHVTGTGCDATDFIDQVVAVDLADAVRFGLSALPNAAAGANGGLPTGNASGQVAVASLANGAITAAAIAADAITAAKIADGAIDAATFAAGAIDNAAIATDAIGSAELAASAVTEIQAAIAAGAIASVTGNVGGNVVGSVGSVATGGIAAASFAAGAIDNAAIATDAIGSAELAASAVTEIQAGLSTLDASGVRGAVGLASANLDTQIAAVQADTDNIQTRLPPALVSGRMDSSVGAMATDTLTSAALAASAVTEIQTGLSTLDASGVRAAVGLASASLDTQLAALAGYIDTEVAAIKAKTDNLPVDPADASDITASFTSIAGTLTTIASYIDTEVAAIKAKTDNLPAAPAAVSDIPTAIQNADALLKRDFAAVTGEARRSVLNAGRKLLNKWTIVGTLWSILKEDDTTVAYTETLTTSAGANPVTGSDPT